MINLAVSEAIVIGLSIWPSALSVYVQAPCSISLLGFQFLVSGHNVGQKMYTPAMNRQRLETL